jgi:hypothetical protein
MYKLITLFNNEWLEDRFTFSFTKRGSAPKKSQAEIDADANRNRALRAEQYAARKTQTAGKRRRRGRSLLIGGDEQGVSDTLG